MDEINSPKKHKLNPPLNETSPLTENLPPQEPSQIIPPPKLSPFFKSVSDFAPPNFLHSAIWSPDGLCLLSNSEDNILRLFETPPAIFTKNNINNDQNNVENNDKKNNNNNENNTKNNNKNNETIKINDWKPLLEMKQGGTVYKTCWNPKMDSGSPTTCIFLVCSRDTPIRSFDAFNGEIKASYSAIDCNDEVTSTFSLCFKSDGNKFISGQDGYVRIFDTARPGRISQKIGLEGNNKKKSKSVVSSIDTFPSGGEAIFACGDYSGKIHFFDERNNEIVDQFYSDESSHGISHLKFTKEGNYIISGARKSNKLLMWDLRQGDQPIAFFKRSCSDNQKISFDFDSSGRYLISGCQLGEINVFDLYSTEENPKPEETITTDFGVINGIDFNDRFNLVAASTGRRHFESVTKLGNSGENFVDSEISESSDNGEEFVNGIFVYKVNE